MNEIKPDGVDQNVIHQTIFLAGSIEMGAAEDWQSKVVNHFKDWQLTFFNPRRESWDSSWKQEQRVDQFNQQVNWELNHLESCDTIFMYFDPASKSPISLMELGLFANSGKMIVCCPDGFWRKGNVEIVCHRHNIPFFHNIEDAIGGLTTSIRQQF